MQPRVIALCVVIIPVLTANVVYLFSAWTTERVPLCIPYIDGCTSISRAARYSDAIFIFRAAMMVNAVLLFWYWRLVQLWLVELDNSRRYRPLLWLGCIGAAFLILYVDFLGSKGDIYRFMRRYGIVFYFSLTPLAQLILIRQVFRLERAKILPSSVKGAATYQLLTCAAMLGIGIVSLILGYTDLETDASQNIVEWNFAILLHLCFLGSYFYWKQTDYRLHVTIHSP